MWHYSRQKKEEERSLHYVDRLLRRSEGEEQASARFGRDERFFLLMDGSCGCSSNALVNDKDAF